MQSLPASQLVRLLMRPRDHSRRGQATLEKAQNSFNPLKQQKFISTLLNPTHRLPLRMCSVVTVGKPIQPRFPNGNLRRFKNDLIFNISFFFLVPGYLGCYDHSRQTPISTKIRFNNDSMTIEKCLEFCRMARFR